MEFTELGSCKATICLYCNIRPKYESQLVHSSNKFPASALRHVTHSHKCLHGFLCGAVNVKERENKLLELLAQSWGAGFDSQGSRLCVVLTHKRCFVTFFGVLKDSNRPVVQNMPTGLTRTNWWINCMVCTFSINMTYFLRCRVITQAYSHDNRQPKIQCTKVNVIVICSYANSFVQKFIK